MVKYFFLFFTLAIFSSAFPQNDSNYIKKDSSNSKLKLGVVPILAFDSDLGLKYGGTINLFEYGDLFPNYLQYAQFRFFNTTKGTSYFSLIYENKKLIKKSKLIFESTYSKDVALNYFGFNGIKTIFNNDFINSNHKNYISSHFYTQERQLARIRIDLLTQLKIKNLFLFTGFNINHYTISPTNLDKLSAKPISNSLTYSPTTLFQSQIDLKQIKEYEQKGGLIPQFSLGIVYDSRDVSINTRNGVWFDTYLIASTKTKQNKGFTKHILTYRLFKTYKPYKTTFSFRFSSQQKLTGEIPFYHLPFFTDTRINQDGLGGAYNLRGISRNRIVADGFLLSNIELRKEFFNFKFIKQNWAIYFSGFSDMTYVNQEHFTFNSSISVPSYDNYFSSSKQKVNYTYGIGMYLIYNANNVISVNYGISPNKNFGNNGLYVSASLLF